MLISDLRRRIHTEGNGLHGRGTTPHAAERNAAHVQGRSATEQASAKTLATAVDDRRPGRNDIRPGRVSEFQQELAGRASGLLQRRGSYVAQLARENRDRGGGRAFHRASQITLLFRD